MCCTGGGWSTRRRRCRLCEEGSQRGANETDEEEEEEEGAHLVVAVELHGLIGVRLERCMVCGPVALAEQGGPCLLEVARVAGRNGAERGRD